MSAKDKIIKNIMKDKYVVSVNGKKYVEYGDVLYWLGTAGCLADGYDFVRQYIPSNKYEDDAFYDIADEFICWMWNLVEIKMASLLSDSLVSKQERK